MYFFVAHASTFVLRNNNNTTEQTEREVILPSYHLKIIADLDQQSRDDKAKKPTWVSTLMDVQLNIDPATKAWSVAFGEQRQLVTSHNEAGRGMELSELVNFNG